METTKQCTSCNIKKELKFFSKHKRQKDGLESYCKKCSKIKKDDFKKTKYGLIARIYSAQKSSSKKRKHNHPSYTKQELENWLFNQDLFHKLFQKWEQSDYETNLIPSVDRKNENIGYTINNIQLMTWQENNEKAFEDIRMGRSNSGFKPQKTVMQYSKKGNLIKSYSSTIKASKSTATSQADISKVCNGKRKTAGGFIWKYK